MDAGCAKRVGNEQISSVFIRQHDAWIKEATKGLCEPAVAYLREQLREQLSRGEELGDPKEANRAFVKTHLTRWEYSLIQHLTLIPDKLPRITGGWTSWALLSSPAVLLLLFIAYFWISANRFEFPNFFLFGILGVLASFIWLVPLLVMPMLQRFHAPSMTQVLERGIYLNIGLIALDCLLIGYVDMVAFKVFFALCVFSTAVQMVPEIRAFPKVFHLEAMGVPYVKPYWEWPEGESKSA